MLFKNSLTSEPPRPAKNWRGGSSTRLQGSSGGTHTDAVVADAEPEVDVEAELVEDADTRDVTSEDPRSLHRPLRASCPARSVATLAGLAENENVLGDLRDGGRDLVLRRQHRHLFLRRLRSRARNDLPEHDIETRFERRDVCVRLTRMPRIVVEVELRLSVRGMQLEPLRHREGCIVDRRHSHEGEVRVRDELALVEGAGAHQDLLDARVEGFSRAVVACPVSHPPHPNDALLCCLCHFVVLVFPQIRPGYYFAASSFV